jgi:hypothetical protein
MESDDVYVYLVFLTDHNDNSNTVEGVFAHHKAAHDWVIARGALSADIYSNSELLRSHDDWWYVIRKVGGVYVKTGQVISIYPRKVQS